jgi:hypothetical protein
MAAAAAETLRQARDRWFERREQRREEQEIAARQRAEEEARRQREAEEEASPAGPPPVDQPQPPGGTTEAIEPCRVDRLPWGFDPGDLIWLLRQLPSLRDAPERLRVPLVRQILPNGILTVGQVTSTLISTNQSPNIWLAGDGTAVGARGGTPQAAVSRDGDGWTAGIRWPVGSFSYPSASGSDVPEVFSVTRAYSAYIHFQPQGFWNSTVTLDLNALDMSTGAGGARVAGQSGVYLEVKPGPFIIVAAAVALYIWDPLPDELTFPLLLEALRRRILVPVP